jgi:replication-associated recombination protein RarA
MTTKTDEHNNKMWVEKYRPNNLSELIAHEQIINTSNFNIFIMILTFIVNRLVSTNRLPHLLLYGPPGTGKTSTYENVAFYNFILVFWQLQNKCMDQHMEITFLRYDFRVISGECVA